VQQSLIWQVPAVTDTWEVETPEEGIDSRVGYLLMEYIEVELVSQVWPGLGVQARRDIHL